VKLKQLLWHIFDENCAQKKKLLRNFSAKAAHKILMKFTQDLL